MYGCTRDRGPFILASALVICVRMDGSQRFDSRIDRVPALWGHPVACANFSYIFSFDDFSSSIGYFFAPSLKG